MMINVKKVIKQLWAIYFFPVLPTIQKQEVIQNQTRLKLAKVPKAQLS